MIDETLFEAEEKMEKAVEVAKEDFAGIRTGRANPGMFNKLTVSYYGAPTPLQQLASFQTPEARTIIISPFDKSSMHAIEKAIQQADLGINPSNDGTIIRCVMPVLTEERRREYVKMAHTQAEDAITRIVERLEVLCQRDDACQMMGELLRKVDLVTKLSAWTEPNKLH